jgi:hypothetical protein
VLFAVMLSEFFCVGDCYGRGQDRCIRTPALILIIDGHTGLPG